MKELYNIIFKRKSFHIFRNTERMTGEELNALNTFIASVKSLDGTIKTSVRIVPESETTCKRGAEYCILFYSEQADNALRNIGYIGEQIDLYCAAQNIGSLWFGIGRPFQMKMDNMDFVIMISIAKMSEVKFRKDMFKAKRKPLEEIWSGSTLGIGEIVRFTPSACNTQPWIVENRKDTLYLYRYKKPGKRGIMPADKVSYYNQIDVGIFMLMLEICLEHKGYKFRRIEYTDSSGDTVEKTLTAEYQLLK